MKKPTPFGKYFLLERINVGGMAEVFRAKAFGVEGFERLLAVKRILPNIAEDKEFIRMFIEEAKLSVQLNHANIAQIFDLGVVDGSYYIALEHVHGRDLRGIFDRCRQLGETMPVAQACFIVMKLCEGLDYAHNKRDQGGRELALVHRDVSPQNVLVSFEGEVKIIDFGIAKAAGKGSKTQAGILKGKFGYMSPEQVRGLPVDRRSDIFSCGIVLYELLTGERLFIGESDFSTLEKVRNVEILPPSTYNRKIPDELERIVLKALAKDVDDRYQNAIDLHDELQAFVYTAGEFYSRKDLAGWMKKTFGKEIDEETAKIESYRQLRPPPVPTGENPRATGAKPALGQAQAPGRRSVQTPVATPAVAANKPPPPPRVSQQVAAAAPASPGVIAKQGKRNDDTGELSWDDDELETKIYDNPEDDPRNKGLGGRTSKPLPLQAPATGPLPGASAAAMSAASAGGLGAFGVGGGEPSSASSGPDLSSLVSTAKGWEAAPSPGSGPIASPASTLNGMGGATPNGRPKLASGSNNVVPPEPSGPLAQPPAIIAHEAERAGARLDMPGRFDSGGMPAVGASSMQAPAMAGPMAMPAMGPRSGPELFDPMSSFGQGVTHRQRSDKKGLVLIAVGGAVLATLIVVVVILVTGGNDASPTATKTPEVGSGTAAPPPAPTDQNTGFDLYVSPAGITQWKLDGESRTDRLPSRIRGITPGSHTVQIDAPPGFIAKTEKVEVAAGKAERVDIKLDAVQGIQGVFESDPPGATVSLIVDGKRQPLGPSPARAPLDPHNTYQVLFEKSGHVSVNRPVVISGALEERIAVVLEKTGASSVEPPKVDPPKTNPPKTDPPKIDPPKTNPPKTDPPKVDPPKTNPPKVDPPKTNPPKVDPPKTNPPPVTGTGVLKLGSKPPCEIYVDGASTGLFTPQPAMKLPAGKHKITLINNEFGVREVISVEISPDKPAVVIKDFTK